MGSSSGQKSPIKTLGSWIGPFPCWAINSSTVGLALKLYRGSLDLSILGLPTLSIATQSYERKPDSHDPGRVRAPPQQEPVVHRQAVQSRHPRHAVKHR